MAMTPDSSLTSYTTPAQLLALFDYRQIADLCRDGNGMPATRLALMDSTTTAGGILAAILLRASGIVEAACTVGKRYTPADLAVLTGASRQHLVALVAGLAMVELSERRWKLSNMAGNPPRDERAAAQLEKLRLGEHVFGLVENQEAAQRMDGVRLEDVDPTEPPGIIERARRYFGNRERV